MFSRIQMPTPNNKLEVYSDGNDDYTVALRDYYPMQCLRYGQVVKIREGGRIVDKIKRSVYGDPDIKQIETTDVENFNGILRERLGRLVRKTKCISKKKSFLNYAIDLFQFHWNYMDPLPSKQTPAMLENLSDHCWSWEEFLYHHSAV